MDHMVETVRKHVLRYAGNGWGADLRLFPVLDEARQTYAVIAIDFPVREDLAGVVVLARIVGNQVIIEEDVTDRKLVDALIADGIPREQIILGYAGEAVPDAEATT